MTLWLRPLSRIRVPFLASAGRLHFPLGARHDLSGESGLRPYPPSRALSSVNVKWLWPVDREALSFHLIHNLGSRMGLFHLTLNAKNPLKTEDVEEALFHLQRKNPTMRVDLRLRENTWWFCDQEEKKVDFKMLSEDTNSMEDFHRLCEQGFPDGNTWVFRMIPRQKDAPCAMPEVKEDFPYQYDLHMTGHHGLSDGLSVSLLVKRMVELLNDVILGRHISDELTSRFLPREELWEIESRITKKLEEDPRRHDYVRETIPDSTPLLLQAFPRPSVDRVTSRILSRTVDLEATQNFQKLCKAHGVTINSAFTAAINTAIVRLVQRSGISQQSYRIASNHLVSALRYLKQTPPDIMGGYALFLSHVSRMNHTSNFWEYSKEVHRELKGALQSELPLEQKMACVMAQPNLAEDWARNPPKVVHDYGITNIAHFPMPERRADDQVLVTNVSSTAMVHKYIHMVLFLVYTFRGRSNYAISYATDYIADETARMLADEVMSVYREVSDLKSI